MHIILVSLILYFNKTEEGKHNPYLFSYISRDSVVIKLIIKRKINKTLRSIEILDSYCILTDSLNTLCEKYEVEVKKDIFPYSFANKNTLFYKGVTPEIHYYKDLEIEQYYTIYTEN